MSCFPPHVFRAFDIRGLVDQELTPEFSYYLGRGYAQLFFQYTSRTRDFSPCISVGWDCRLTSVSYAQSLIKGLEEEGLEVLPLGVCPTPVTYFSLFSQSLEGCIMVTGSHNDASYNGFKICIGSDCLHGKSILKLRNFMESLAADEGGLQPKQPIKKNTRQTFDIITPYIHYIVNQIGPLKKKKIVLDAGNGTASVVAPELFKQLGADVIPLFCELDGRFPHHHPDPTLAKNLEALIHSVQDQKADFGLAFDGDADRLGVVNNQGEILYGDEILILLSRHLLKKHPGATIISEVKSSQRLYNDIASHGGKALMWKTGHSLIKEKMKETGALLAGEMSGHIFFSDQYFGYDDALYAGSRLYALLCENDRPLSQLLMDLPKTFSTPEIRIECQEEKKEALILEAKKIISKNFHINDLDGIRIQFGDSWGLIRASQTQPAVVMRCESLTETGLKRIQNILERALFESSQILHHPSLLFPSSSEMTS